MKNLMCLMLVTMLGFSPMMAAVAEEAAIAGQESSEAVDQDDAWDEPIDIEYEEDGTEETEEVAGEEVEISPFVGEWLCDNASIYDDEGDGG